MYVLARIISVLTQLLLEASTTLASAAGIKDYYFFFGDYDEENIIIQHSC